MYENGIGWAAGGRAHPTILSVDTREHTMDCRGPRIQRKKKSKPFAWDVFNMLHALAERNGGAGLEWGEILTDRKDGPRANRIIVVFIT